MTTQDEPRQVVAEAEPGSQPGSAPAAAITPAPAILPPIVALGRGLQLARRPAPVEPPPEAVEARTEPDDEDEEPPTQRPAPRAEKRLQRETLYFEGQVAGPVLPFQPAPEAPPPAKRWAMQTMLADAAPARPVLPFQPSPPVHDGCFALKSPVGDAMRPTIGTILAAEVAQANTEPARSAVPQEPSIALDQYAAIQAEIWEGISSLDEILERHGVDETAFRAHERRQGQALAREAGEGRSALALALDDALRAARAGLEDPGARKRTLDEYVAIQVALDGAKRASDVLGSMGITGPDWQRLRQHWRGRAAADPRLAAELREKLSAARQAKASPRGRRGSPTRRLSSP